jgi:serine/threonine protein kinase
MQYVRGTSLQERIDRAGPLDVQEILRIGMQTAAGLAAAHAQGLVHRDIKPANILLENGVERVKITDFGLARAIDDASLTESGVVPGTPQYMAPEQARGETVDHRADLFILGSVLFAMCTGRPPFRGTSSLAIVRSVPLSLFVGDRGVQGVTTKIVLENSPEDSLTQVPIQAFSVRYFEKGGDPTELRPSMLLEFDEETGARLSALSGRNIGKRMAILFGDRVVQVPKIQSQVGQKVQITGRFSSEELAFFTAVLTANEMPLELVPIGGA